MAGLQPARACYSPTDFKSVASTISPHRRWAHTLWGKCFMQMRCMSKIFIAVGRHAAARLRTK